MENKEARRVKLSPFCKHSPFSTTRWKLPSQGECNSDDWLVATRAVGRVEVTLSVFTDPGNDDDKLRPEHTSSYRHVSVDKHNRASNQPDVYKLIDVIRERSD